MSIPPTSNQPISNDQAIPPSDPTNATIEKLPTEILGRIIFCAR